MFFLHYTQQFFKSLVCDKRRLLQNTRSVLANSFVFKETNSNFTIWILQENNLHFFKTIRIDSRVGENIFRCCALRWLKKIILHGPFAHLDFYTNKPGCCLFQPAFGCCPHPKLVKTFFQPFFNLFCSFQSSFSDFTAEINKKRLKMMLLLGEHSWSKCTNQAQIKPAWNIKKKLGNCCPFMVFPHL